VVKICKTDGAVYEINIYENKIVCIVELPPTVSVYAVPIGVLRDRIHHGVEEALSVIFPQYGQNKK
jgi:hypothetical protein